MASKPPFEMPEGDYAGDVSCRQAWDALTSEPDALLVDVRTKVEWQLIGRPDLSSLGKEPVYLQWVTMDGVNQNFPDELKAALDERGMKADTPVYFMCQSGGRSKMSAMQCTELGYTQCFNIAEGFEGDLDEHQHRNSVSGWKVAGLPWTQA
ncbi:MAG: rhodanese-like domain-containing protein [Gammaproteobacteria bacterium]|jgi:rhodanese-related sulfurtransferase|nr:rhodanese-like domain-containing protein [Gammaproteobacteria bacterium]MDP6617781.1 rhodanese-like domain-containing protein [Gammaproteobacteria bacterium]MDP6694167.1 rhodanese-like domain-containing protein [Gammaproteobacteria bacterium]